jgi:hypothetical protein
MKTEKNLSIDPRSPQKCLSTATLRNFKIEILEQTRDIRRHK